MAPRKTAREVLNELRWREGDRMPRARLWVRGRTKASLTVLAGDAIVELGRRYFSTATATIPYYKIARIECDGAVVFDRQD